ncbi:MAG: hypothetical protein OSA49_06575 [Ascidiaceihabitans sp.]|nr:hypothetical protein [Ascidiaceihabitans sp.]
MTLFHTLFASRILRFVVLSILLIVAMYLTVRIAATIVYWSGKLYRPGVSTGIWGFFFWVFASTMGFLALVCLFLRPAKVRLILLGYNLLALVVLFSVFRHENHDIWFWVTFLFSALASNLIIYFAMRFDRGAKTGSS